LGTAFKKYRANLADDVKERVNWTNGRKREKYKGTEITLNKQYENYL
jgi:hypothetical protein